MPPVTLSVPFAPMKKLKFGEIPERLTVSAWMSEHSALCKQMEAMKVVLLAELHGNRAEVVLLLLEMLLVCCDW